MTRHGAWAVLGLMIGIGHGAWVSANPVPAELPRPTQPCPAFAEGRLEIGGRAVEVLAIGPDTRPGPLLLYWHGTGSTPRAEIGNALGDEVLQWIRDRGGLVAAPISSGEGAGRSTSGNGVWFEADFALADEIVACANQQLSIDQRRIHALGMSAGGLHVAAMAYRRSTYLASVVTYSGGHLVFRGRDVTDTSMADDSNPVAALVVHGGPADQYIVRFDVASEAFASALRERQHPVMLCDHGQGHRIARGSGALAWAFLNAHPFGDGNGGALAGETLALCSEGHAYHGGPREARR